MMSHAPRLFAALRDLFNHHITVLVRTAGLALRPSVSVSKASRFCPCLFALLHLSLRAIWCRGLAAHARPPLFFASLLPRFGDTRPSPSFFTLLVPYAYGVETSTCMIWGTLDSPKRVFSLIDWRSFEVVEGASLRTRGNLFLRLRSRPLPPSSRPSTS